MRAGPSCVVAVFPERSVVQHTAAAHREPVGQAGSKTTQLEPLQRSTSQDPICPEGEGLLHLQEDTKERKLNR